jgi:hypothetical protein
MSTMKMWYVPCHFLSLINYVHTHYIYTNINSSFEFFVIENKFKKKKGFLLVLHYLCCGFYEFQHVYSMMQNLLKLLIICCLAY